jgi:integrase
MTTARRWSYSTGERGRNRVRVFEDGARPLLVEFYEGGTRKRVSLGHRDRRCAKQQADEIAAALGRGTKPTGGDTTLAMLFDNYLREVSPTKGPHKQAHDQRATRMLLAILGPGRRLSGLTHRDAARFVAERRRRGDQRAGKCQSRPIGMRVVEYDLKFLQATLNWGVRVGWIDRNPLQGFRVHREQSPKRPILTETQYQQLLAVSRDVGPLYRLALVMTNETGHRIGAVSHLRWSDIDLDRGCVTWRGEHDKQAGQPA